MKLAQRFTVLLVGSKLLQTLIFANSLEISTLLATFSSATGSHLLFATGSHLLFVRLLGLLDDEKGLESFPLLQRTKNKINIPSGFKCRLF